MKTILGKKDNLTLKEFKQESTGRRNTSLALNFDMNAFKMDSEVESPAKNESPMDDDSVPIPGAMNFSKKKKNIEVTLDAGQTTKSSIEEDSSSKKSSPPKSKKSGFQDKDQGMIVNEPIAYNLSSSHKNSSDPYNYSVVNASARDEDQYDYNDSNRFEEPKTRTRVNNYGSVIMDNNQLLNDKNIYDEVDPHFLKFKTTEQILSEQLGGDIDFSHIMINGEDDESGEDDEGGEDEDQNASDYDTNITNNESIDELERIKRQSGTIHHLQPPENKQIYYSDDEDQQEYIPAPKDQKNQFTVSEFDRILEKNLEDKVKKGEIIKSSGSGSKESTDPNNSDANKKSQLVTDSTIDRAGFRLQGSIKVYESSFLQEIGEEPDSGSFIESSKISESRESVQPQTRNSISPNKMSIKNNSNRVKEKEVIEKEAKKKHQNKFRFKILRH